MKKKQVEFKKNMDSRVKSIVLSNAKREKTELSQELMLKKMQEEKERLLNKFLSERDTFIQQKIENEIAKKCEQRLHHVIAQSLHAKHTHFYTLSKLEQSKMIQAELTRIDLSRKSTRQIVEILAANAYLKSNENPILAGQCFEAGLSEDQFNKALKVYKEHKLSDNLPSIFIDGRDIGEPDYYFCKLALNDSRGLLLGFYTTSCQSIGGYAESVAIYGMLSEDSGFYVVMKKKNAAVKPDIYNDKIVCQSWAWISQGESDVADRAFTFDSIELLQPSKASSFMKFYQIAANQILGHSFMEADDEVNNQRCITSVMLGKGGGTPDMESQLETAESPALPKEKLYYDADEQWVLAKSELAASCKLIISYH